MWSYALGVRRRRKQKTLDVLFPVIYKNENPTWDLKIIAILLEILKITPQKNQNSFALIDELQLQKILNKIDPDFEKFSQEVALIESYLNFKPETTNYSQAELLFYYYHQENTVSCDEKDQLELQSVEEAYFKLQLISQRHVEPNQVNLKNLFATLPVIAWTNQGPILPEEVSKIRSKHYFDKTPLTVSHVDKFPYLLDYHIPSKVRITDTSRVRLGAYLGEGCTIMPAGYVNFNAGAKGPSMIEGRISAGVFVQENSDIGGGASIMGTLSGGNDLKISIGTQCLLGANSGTGISLGNNCTIAAGLYIYSGMKISLQDATGKPINIEGNPALNGEHIVKAIELSGRNNMLFIKDSQTGEVICKPNQKAIQLNEELHKN